MTKDPGTWFGLFLKTKPVKDDNASKEKKGVYKDELPTPKILVIVILVFIALMALSWFIYYEFK